MLIGSCARQRRDKRGECLRYGESGKGGKGLP